MVLTLHDDDLNAAVAGLYFIGTLDAVSETAQGLVYYLPVLADTGRESEGEE